MSVEQNPVPAVADERFMRRAIELAAATAGLASPNPQVGCVLVRDGVVLGEGAHLYEFKDHAEIVALKQAAAHGHDVRGCTAYVTLEPCSHTGRTGPCSDALIAADVGRVVVATQDPNPLVSGGGIAKLRAAGIDVVVGMCQQQARDLNDAFAHFIQHRVPFVTLKAALSVDGKLAPPAATRTANQPFWLTGPAARAEVQRLRHASDVLLTGIGTVLADDPALTDRTGLPRRRPLLRVVLDSQLRLPLDSQLVRSATEDLLVFCSSDAPNNKIAALLEVGVEVLPLPDDDGRLDLKMALGMLGTRNMTSVLIEGGSQLNGALLTRGLVDRLVLFYAETELGSEAIPFAEGVASPFLLEQQLTRVTRTTFGPDACVSGYLHDPWAATP